MTPVTDHPGTSGLDTLPRVRRTSTTLADGRELIYFDDSEPYRSGAKRRDVAASAIAGKIVDPREYLGN